MVFSEKVDEILGAGCFLGEIGINNWLLDKQQCLISINELKRIDVAILGIDTFFEGGMNPTGDILSCDKEYNETDADYLARSHNEAIVFVSNPIYYDFKFILIPKI